MKQVKIALGYSAVPLNGKIYNQGAIVTLTDDQYNALPFYIQQQIVDVSSGFVGSPVPPNIPDSTDPDTSSYTDRFFENELIARGVAITLKWDGTTYQPVKLLDSIDRPKTFIGPQDPSSFAGVQLAVRDQWIDN